ncbi:MAG: nitrite reductase [Desulfobulbaceae bacterium A2]|nr:MAG: nitrite reductase [Desulfobulbaceae bacterium A2]
MKQTATAETKDTSYVILPGLHMGMLTLTDLERLTALVRKYQVPGVKVTGAQRVAFLGLAPERLAALRSELGLPEGAAHTRGRLHTVQACPGKAWCKYGLRDSLALGRRLEELTLERPLPAKVKVGISGCPMNCCESSLRDVGLQARNGGWRLSFGGNAANRPRIGDVVAEGLDDDQALALVRRCLEFYTDKAVYKTRSARFMERFGIDVLQQGVLDQDQSAI